MECTICENRCHVPENGTGICGTYTNRNGTIAEKYPGQYLVVVPSEIESMPMLHFHPGGKFLQICTIGCNFRCSGCVSWILTESVRSIEGALHHMSPEEVVDKAHAEGCSGIMFCFNEPAVSFLTFKKVASLARRKGLLVGCATNAYFTEASFRDLLRHIDFVNIGMKGCTDETYSSFGARSVSPILRNLRLSIESGVFTEVAAVYVKGREDEVLETARLVASISKDVPFQVMRFIPLAGADVADEPSIREAEALCEEIKKILNYVYLFNSPGTAHLDTYCLECGKALVQRGFNGPMCAHVSAHNDDGACVCGFRPPFVGAFEKERGAQVLGFFGGYKTILSLESIQTVLAFLGERNPAVVASVFQQILETDFIKGLYERTKGIDSYLDTVDHYARLAGRTGEARELRGYTENCVSIIKKRAEGARRPTVYFCLGHPLIAVFGDKFECNLVEIAGGRCLNKDLVRDDTPGMTLPEEALRMLDPEVILITGAIAYPVDDLCRFCISNGLGDVTAIRDRRVYGMHPYNTGGRPDWILGLMQIANILHPELFNFDVNCLAEEFYERFLGVKLLSMKHSRSITHPAVLGESLPPFGSSPRTPIEHGGRRELLRQSSAFDKRREMSLRKARPDDAPAIAGVQVDSWRSAYRGIVPDDRLRSLDYVRGAERFRDAIVTGPEEIYAAVEADAVAGFLVLGPCRDPDIDPGSTGEIWGMYISPPYWRRGIGRSMCREAEGALRSRGHSRVVLWVFEDNQRARRFYEAMGFTPDGTRKVLDMGACLNAVRYHKSLRA